MAMYNATTPPDCATCGIKGCATTAAVRLIIPKSRFEADGIDHDNAPATFDTCEWHWPGMRDACLRNGHLVADITGDIRQLATDFPHCTIFTSDGGRLYASTRLPGAHQGTTVDAFLAGQLRRKLETLTTVSTSGTTS